MFLTGGKKLNYDKGVAWSNPLEYPVEMGRLDPEAEFTAVLRYVPKSAPALTARAEARLTRLLFWHDDPTRIVDMVIADAKAALDVDQTFWRAHLALGAGYCCKRSWDEATAAFQKLAPPGKAKDLWYLMFLMATGKITEALQIAMQEADEHPDDPVAQTAYGLVLYMTRRFVKADEQLLKADVICQKKVAETGLHCF
jgi:tetratricopeptide (TPR) repeat protein